MIPGVGVTQHLLLYFFCWIYCFLLILFVSVSLTMLVFQKMTYFTFYGTMERYFDPAFNKRVLIAIFGMEIAVTDVSSKHEGVLFSERHAGLKAMIAAINAAFNEGRISLSEKNRRLREAWIPATEVFADD